jgi:hypothetical protein
MSRLDSVTSLVEIGVGLALVLSALVWAMIGRGRRGAKKLVRQALANADPRVRRAAVALAGDGGLSRNSRLLLAVARYESDPAVLEALAATISRNQWEPASNPRIVELRLWARRYLDAGVRRTNGSRPGRLEREIFTRDGYRCAFTDDRGRCGFRDESGAELVVYIAPLSARRNGAVEDTAAAATTVCRRHFRQLERGAR